MTTTLTIDQLAAVAATIRANMRGQAKPGRAVLLTAEDAQVLLAYVSALERDRDAWQAVATRAELERNGVVDNNKG